MKLLVMDMKGDDGMGINLCVRSQDSGHQVRYWSGTPHYGGKGIIQKVREWEDSMDWADLIVLTGNCDYPNGLDKYFGRGYPIFGTNPKAAELELDRGKGQEILKKYGIKTAPYTVVSSVKEAINHIVKTETGYAMKPWGGAADKAMTCVCKSPDDAIFTLMKWEKDGLFKGELMLQELVEGVEVGIAGWFGPGGWSAAIEESFEHKKFLNDDLGENTGEMGTVIRHVTESKLFDMLLEPLTDYLHMVNYVGDCSVNCIVDKRGTPWPLEFTVRLGWPDFNIRQALIKNDPIEWMLDLLQGRDTLEVSTDVAAGLVLTHGDFPRSADPHKDWAGYPIRGITPQNYKHLHFQQTQRGMSPMLVDGKVKEVETEQTGGTYVMVVTGTGRTVKLAAQRMYDVAWDIKWASNIMFRTDIGKRLEEDLPLLQKHGYAVGMRYG
jgi:phosphoribosylamine--glycine ligase